MMKTVKTAKKTWFSQTNILFLLILMVGALVRLLYLGSVPGGLHQDEAIVAWNAYSLFNYGYDSAGHVWPMYVADWGDGHSLLYPILTLPFIALSGNHLSHFMTRLPQALVGIFTIWVLYGILKRMFNEKMGLWGAFLLAICPWHITMCRWGLDANLVPGFLMFGLYFFIRGLDNEKYLLLSGLFYGLTLHSYAVIWPFVPLVLLIQILYGLYHKKLRINRWSIGASCILFVLAFPLILFVLVNSGLIEEIYLPFMSIPAMSGYRAGELAITPDALWHNLKRILSLLGRHDTGAIYDIIMPSGLFYDLGRIFIIIGFCCMMWKLLGKKVVKEFSYEFFIFAQLIAAGAICLLVEVDLHQANCLFIPLVMCEAYGVVSVLSGLKRWVQKKSWHKKNMIPAVTAALVGVFLLYFGQFEYLYFTEYKDLVSLYFAEGISESVPYAMEKAEEIHDATGTYPKIIAHRGAQWPRLLYYAETDGQEYLTNIQYKENGIEPYSFTSDGITFVNEIDMENIDPDAIYIFYYDTLEFFEQNYEVENFIDWYVGVPTGNEAEDGTTPGADDAADPNAPVQEETVQGLAPVIVISTDTKEWYMEDGSKLLLEVSNSIVSVENEGFDALKATLAEHFAGVQGEYDALVQLAQEDYDYRDEVGKEYFWGYFSYENAELARSDSSVVSFRITYNDYTGGAHGMYGYGGKTFDVESGELLEFADILTDAEGFYEKAGEYISAKLYEEYGDELWGDYRESVSQTFGEGGRPCWYLNAAGIVIAYSPYELGPYAMGAPEVILPYAEFKDYINAKYLGDYAEVVASVPENCDISTLIGEKESIILETGLNEWEMLDVKVVSGASMDEMGAFSFLENACIIKRSDGRSFLIVACDSMSDDYVTIAYEVTGGGLKKCAELSDTYFSGEYMSPDRMEMIVSLDVLGTYNVEMDFVLNEEGRLTPAEDIFVIDSEHIMTVKKELPVTMDGTDTALEVGTQIVLTGTNNVDEVYFRVADSDGTGTIRYTMEDVESWVHLIDGISEYEYFDDIPYAG